MRPDANLNRTGFLMKTIQNFGIGYKEHVENAI